MSSARPLSLVAAVLLAGCPADENSQPWYEGVWKLEQVCGGFAGTCRDPTANDRYQVIELSGGRFVEYRDGQELRSAPATYHEEQCITGHVRPRLAAEDGPYWCLSGDRERLDGFDDNYDGFTYSFGRCLAVDSC